MCLEVRDGLGMGSQAHWTVSEEAPLCGGLGGGIQNRDSNGE